MKCFFRHNDKYKYQKAATMSIIFIVRVGNAEEAVAGSIFICYGSSANL